MNDDDALVARYRACAEEVTTSALDAAILAAARRHSAARQRRRRAGMVGAACAAAWIYSMAWRPHPEVVNHSNHAEGYGRSEGMTRSYLLEVASSRYLGPGSAEGVP